MMTRSGRVAWSRATARIAGGLVALLVLGAGWGPTPQGRADNVVLRDGLTLRGSVDKDNALFIVSDSLKRTIVYNARVARHEPEGVDRLERFQLVQPLEVHGGVMPNAVYDVAATPWDAKGRRGYQFRTERGKVAMQQAINEIGPNLVRYRGIDGFYNGQMALGQVPRDVILGLLAKVEQANEGERQRVARFLIQAQWYPEARAALDTLQRDFPHLKENVTASRTAVIESAARDALIAAGTARRAQQPTEARRILRAIDSPDLSRETRDEAQTMLRQFDEQDSSDRALADRVRDLLAGLSEPERPAWRGRVAEILRVVAQAPDVARLRLEPAAPRSPEAETTPPSSEARFARAMSAWVVGPDLAVDAPTRAGELWEARRLVRNYLTGRDDTRRAEPAGRPRPADPSPTSGPTPPPPPAPTPAPAPGPGATPAATAAATTAPGAPATPPAASGSGPVPEDPARVRAAALEGLNALQAAGALTPPVLEAIVTRLAPPLDEPREGESRAVTTHRVADDENPIPTEYAVLLPPEYHPLRSYPAVVALHDGNGPRAAIDWVAAEAARRGYIVIAPEYNSPGKGRGYHHSSEEHAAVQLSLRDARKRYAIDSDRVFLAGQLVGAVMAWDLGLAHPDLFAGVVAVSGIPIKYVYAYKAQMRLVPTYVVLGSLAPAARDIIFDRFIRPAIEDVKDVTYVDYLGRGLEPLPEEVPAFFDWMTSHHRDPVPRTFSVATARESDARFFGVIAQEIAQGRTTTPEGADELGRHMRPATIQFKASATGNLLNLTVSGINRLDVWISPKLIDFNRKVEVRVNDKPLFKGNLKPDLALMLDDLRVRGDRQQLYLGRVSSGGASKSRRP